MRRLTATVFGGALLGSTQCAQMCRSGVRLLLLLSFLDGFAEFTNRRDSGTSQRILSNVAPDRRAVERMIDAALVDGEGIVGRANFSLRMEGRILRVERRIARFGLAATTGDPYAVVRGLHNDGAIVDRTTADRRLHNSVVTLSNGDNEVGGLRVLYGREPAPFGNSAFDLIESLFISDRKSVV